jgi:outer membrane protein assembly factor BamB
VIIAVNDAPNDNPALVYAFDAATGQVRWKFVPPA